MFLWFSIEIYGKELFAKTFLNAQISGSKTGIGARPLKCATHIKHSNRTIIPSNYGDSRKSGQCKCVRIECREAAVIDRPSNG